MNDPRRLGEDMPSVRTATCGLWGIAVLHLITTYS